METLTISLPVSLKEFIDEQTCKGEFGSESEYIQSLIHEAQVREAKRELEAKLIDGLKSPRSPMTSADWDALKGDSATESGIEGLMSLQIDKSDLARQDLAEQAEYIRRDNPRAALRFLEAAEEAFQKLAAMPQLGALEDVESTELTGLRCWPIHGFKKHLVFYLPVENGIYVVPVLHGSRDIGAILGR